MSKSMKFAILVVVVLAAAFGVYRYYTRVSYVGSKPSIDTSKWQTVSSTPGYEAKYPEGFTRVAVGSIQSADFVNTKITEDHKSALISTEVSDNSKNLSLQDWFDQQLKDGILPAYATSTKIVRNATVGGKQTIIVTPSGPGTGTYFFAYDNKIISVHEYLAADYMDGFIRNFKLK